MNINDINKYLREGKTVKEIRSIEGIGEKKFQKKIKELGYEYNQKIKQYTEIENDNTTDNKKCSTKKIGDNTANNKECSTEEVSNNTADNKKCIININKTTEVLNPLGNSIDPKTEYSLNIINDNIDILEEILKKYKHAKDNSINTYGMVIDLIDDRHIDNGKPKSVRVNEFVWEEWKVFTKEIHYSGKELVSMALKEYMEKYKQQK